MDAYEYYSKIDDIGKDQSKFHELKINYEIYPVITKENSSSYYVC